MYLVGCAYNFCWEHDSLRVAAGPGSRLKWSERTPAMAAGLTDHMWTMRELLRTADSITSRDHDPLGTAR
jgi:hypothetical protein